MEPPGQQHPGLGIGQFGYQRRGQSAHVYRCQRRRQLILDGLAGRARRPVGGVGERDQPPALGHRGRGLPISLRRDGTGHHRAPAQRAVERLPGQVVANVQSVQPVGGLERPRDDQRKYHDHQHAERQGDGQLRAHVISRVASLLPAVLVPRVASRLPAVLAPRVASLLPAVPATCTLTPAPATVS